MRRSVVGAVTAADCCSTYDSSASAVPPADAHPCEINESAVLRPILPSSSRVRYAAEDNEEPAHVYLTACLVHKYSDTPRPARALEEVAAADAVVVGLVEERWRGGLDVRGGSPFNCIGKRAFQLGSTVCSSVCARARVCCGWQGACSHRLAMRQTACASSPFALPPAHPAWSRRTERCSQVHLASEWPGEARAAMTIWLLRRTCAERASEDVRVY